MKKHLTAKHKKRVKKQRANRKAKRLAIKVGQGEAKETIKIDNYEVVEEEAKPISPARRAFQDV